MPSARLARRVKLTRLHGGALPSLTATKSNLTTTYSPIVGESG
jgi:hypothetical protein